MVVYVPVLLIVGIVNILGVSVNYNINNEHGRSNQNMDIRVRRSIEQSHLNSINKEYINHNSLTYMNPPIYNDNRNGYNNNVYNENNNQFGATRNKTDKSDNYFYKMYKSVAHGMNYLTGANGSKVDNVPSESNHINSNYRRNINEINGNNINIYSPYNSSNNFTPYYPNISGYIANLTYQYWNAFPRNITYYNNGIGNNNNGLHNVNNNRTYYYNGINNTYRGMDSNGFDNLRNGFYKANNYNGLRPMSQDNRIIKTNGRMNETTHMKLAQACILCSTFQCPTNQVRIGNQCLDKDYDY